MEPLSYSYLFASDGLVKTDQKLYFHYQRYKWDLVKQENNPNNCEHQRRVEKRIHRGIDTSNAQFLKGTYILGIAPFSSNYYHFITDLLPFLISTSKWPILLSHRFPQSYLNFLDICGFSTQILSENSYQIESLLIPEWSSWNSRKIEQLRTFIKRIIAIPSPNNTPRIYISRQLAQNRHLKNEEEFLPILENYGFQKVYLEKLPIVGQVQLMAQATHIIAPHGAGLINAIFSSKNTNILEIRPRLNSGQFCFEDLFSLGWNNYQFLVPPEQDQFYMPIENLRETLKKWFGRSA